MKKIATKRRLLVTREVVKQLSEPLLADVAGGRVRRLALQPAARIASRQQKNLYLYFRNAIPAPPA